MERKGKRLKKKNSQSCTAKWDASAKLTSFWGGGKRGPRKQTNPEFVTKTGKCQIKFSRARVGVSGTMLGGRVKKSFGGWRISREQPVQKKRTTKQKKKTVEEIRKKK